MYYICVTYSNPDRLKSKTPKYHQSRHHNFVNHLPTIIPGRSNPWGGVE